MSDTFDPDDLLAPVDELRHFTNRKDELNLLTRVLNTRAGVSLPVLHFYGVGGNGRRCC